MNRLVGLTALTIVAIFTPQIGAVEKAEVDRAVQNGVRAVRSLQSADGSWPARGMTALGGLTLIECDVPRSDPAVQKAAEFVRNEAIDATQVYPVCTALLFLDLLNDPIDLQLIELLSVRLLTGQFSNGGFGYELAPPSNEEKDFLKNHYKAMKGKVLEPVKKPRATAKLTDYTKARLATFRPISEVGQNCDHSNTQFATLALWIARRYGVPVEAALKGVDRHYRTTQNQDSGWGYFIIPGNEESRTTFGMTCAGILGLSVQHGVALSTSRSSGAGKGPPDPSKDPQMKSALARVGLLIDKPASITNKPIPKLTGHEIYSLWSLERILVALDLKEVGGKDWYNWGAEMLLANQSPTGSWSAGYSAYGADTCFALLFLRKSNLAGDLTASLKHPPTLKTNSGGTEAKDPPPSSDPKKTIGTAESGNTRNTGNSKPSTDATASKSPAETKPTFTQGSSAGLAEKLIKETSSRQGAILDQMRDSKGVEYTEALAGAIPQLSGESRRKAREALAERLARMKPDTLGRYLQDDNLEIRRAAALASGTREITEHVPQLIELLADADQGVALAGYTALTATTRQTIGPSADLWRAWWKTQAKKP